MDASKSHAGQVVRFTDTLFRWIRENQEALRLRREGAITGVTAAQ